MQVHHLSHTDLDGYGCQLITSYLFETIRYYNANYGKEVGAKLEEIIRRTQESEEREFLWLVSDLNLTLQECALLEESATRLKEQGKEVELWLLDHHISGSECAKNHAWYYLDNDRCATKITYEAMQERYPNRLEPWLGELVEVVNAIDLWKEESPHFELGKVLMRLVVETKELNRYMFDEAHREYKFEMIRESRRFLQEPRGAIGLDNAMHAMKKRALGGEVESDTLDNIASNAQVALMGQRREACSLEYRGKKGFLSYAVGNISVLANAFLRAYPEFDFFIDVGMKGSVSLRANNNCDVSALSAEVFGGGGHKNAAGGRIEGFKESFLYEEVKNQVEQIIKEKTK